MLAGDGGTGSRGGALEPTKPPVRTGDLGTGRGWKRELPGDVERTRPVGFKTRTSLVGPPRGSCCFFTFIGGPVFPMRQLLRQVWRQPYPFDLGDSCLAMPVLRRAMVRAHEAQPPSLRKECASAPRSTRNMGCLVAVCRPTLLRRSYHCFSSASHPVSMITSSLRDVIYRLQKKERLRVG